MFISEEGTNSPFNVELFKDFQQLVLQAQISFFFLQKHKKQFNESYKIATLNSFNYCLILDFYAYGVCVEEIYTCVQLTSIVISVELWREDLQ